MIQIYIDVYFFINFTVDFLSLFSVEKILLIPSSRARCFISALIGALYSLFHLIYGFSTVWHIPVAILMVTIITYKKRISYIFGGFAIFIGAEIFIGGAIYAIKSLSRLFNKSSLLLASVIILLSLLGCQFYSLVQLLLQKRMAVSEVKARIWYKGKATELLLMIDSGNLVREHFTKNRVIFVKSDAITNIVGDISTLFETEKSYVIPIDTTAGKSTVIGFIPEKIEFSIKKYNVEKFIVVPDVSGGRFAGYDGIAPLL